MNAAQRARQYFEELTREQAAEAIRRMSGEGYSDHTIAHACRLAVEEVRQVLTEAGS